MAISARKRSDDAKLRSGEAKLREVRRLPSEGLQHIADEGLGEVAGEAIDGGGVLADEAAEVLGGLVLLAVGDVRRSGRGRGRRAR